MRPCWSRREIASSAVKPSSQPSRTTVLDNAPLLRRRREDRTNRFRRGVFLLPSLFTVANLFGVCLWFVHSTRSVFDPPALFIGIAMVLNTLDGFFARLTHSSSAF